LAGRTDAKARFLNLAMLIAGYGFGQGSIFVAQTWLVAHGRLELLAMFGTHFAFAMFGILVVDANALTILARHAASRDDGAQGASTLWRTFWETSSFRALLATLVIGGGALGAVVIDEPFTDSYVLFAAPAFAVWAINAAGLLDGLKLSGMSGVSGSLAYASSAIALLFVQGLDHRDAGAVLGAAFTGGYVLTVAAQFAALRAFGWRARLKRPRVKGVLAASRAGIALLGVTLPSQLHFRIQLLLGSLWLGPHRPACSFM
jgi:hypothetical protein